MSTRTERQRPLMLGMIGGGRDAGIGAVHRTAARLDGHFRLVAGALSSMPEKAIASAHDLGLAPERSYPTWQAMLKGELARPSNERIDLVSIVTPNHAHFEPALAFVQAGIPVVIDKPMTSTLAQATQLKAAVSEHNAILAVTYTYAGYPLVKQARAMVAAGDIGAIRKVVVEYTQGWLAQNLAAAGHKQAAWRADPALAGAGGCIGDIGSHCEQILAYVTGLQIESLCADLTAFVPGRTIDDDASVLLRFVPIADQPPARGVLCASQVCIGSENDLRMRVHGTRGSLLWNQEEPNLLLVRTEDEPERIYRRGKAYLEKAVGDVSRLPSGHPEGFLEAFANIYTAVSAAIRARAGADAPKRFDFPGVDDGLRGVAFIERVVENAANNEKWTRL